MRVEVRIPKTFLHPAMRRERCPDFAVFSNIYPWSAMGEEEEKNRLLSFLMKSAVLICRTSDLEFLDIWNRAWRFCGRLGVTGIQK